MRFGDTPPLTIGGYAFTDSVDKDLWDNWFEANKDMPIIKDGLLYADERKDAAKDWAREHEGVVTGFEGIDPQNPGKIVRGIYKGDRPL